MPEDNKYPDLPPPPNGLGDLKEIKPIRGIRERAPQIRWGNEYMAWPIEKRLDYAEKLASSMNHAADILQQERAKMLVLIQNQEAQLKSNAVAYGNQGQLMHKELTSADAAKQKLLQENLDLKAQVKTLTRQLADLKNGV